MDQVVQNVEHDAFYHRGNRILFRRMSELHDSGQPIDAATVVNLLRSNEELEKIGGIDRINELQSWAATASNVDHYCKIIQDKYLQRQLIKFGEVISDSAYVDDPHELAPRISEIVLSMNGSHSAQGDLRIARGSRAAEILLNEHIPKPHSILGDGLILERGFTLFYGRPGLGKTWAAFQLALAVAGGRDWFGVETAQCPVGILEMEMHAWHVQQRLRAITEMEGSTKGLENVHILARPNFVGQIDLTQTSCVNGIISWCKEKHIRLLIGDAMSRLHYSDENDAKDMGKVFAGMERIQHEASVAFCAIHHEPKTSGDKSMSDMDAARGTARFQSDALCMLRMRLLRGRRIIRVAKINLGTEIDDIYLDQSDTGPLVVGEKPRDNAATHKLNRDKIEKLLYQAGKAGALIGLLADKTDLSKNTVRTHLKDMEAVFLPQTRRWMHRGFLKDDELFGTGEAPPDEAPQDDAEGLEGEPE